MAKRKKSKHHIVDLYHDSNSSPQSRKKFHVNDLIKIRPKTDNQQELYNLWQRDKSLFLYGYAGTGKTFLALYLALSQVLDPNSWYKKLLIVRSNVQSRDLGLLPGTVEEKIAEYEKPYRTICDQIFPWKKSYDNMKEVGIIQFEPTSFLRGHTFDNTIVIVDEAQNLSFQELDTIMTRLGENSKIVFCGDINQNDLIQKKHDQSGFRDFLKIIRQMAEYFDTLEFQIEDIVRSNLVKQYIIAKSKIM